MCNIVRTLVFITSCLAASGSFADAPRGEQGPAMCQKFASKLKCEARGKGICTWDQNKQICSEGMQAQFRHCRYRDYYDCVNSFHCTWDGYYGRCHSIFHS